MPNPRYNRNRIMAAFPTLPITTFPLLVFTCLFRSIVKWYTVTVKCKNAVRGRSVSIFFLSTPSLSVKCYLKFSISKCNLHENTKSTPNQLKLQNKNTPYVIVHHHWLHCAIKLTSSSFPHSLLRLNMPLRTEVGNGSIVFIRELKEMQKRECCLWCVDLTWDFSNNVWKVFVLFQKAI